MEIVPRRRSGYAGGVTSKQQLQLTTVAVIVAVAVGGLFWLDSAPSTPPAPLPKAAAPAPVAANPSATEGEPTSPAVDGGPAVAGARPSEPPAAPDAPLRVYTEAELALPPEVPDPPGADACELLKKDETSLGFTTAMLEKLPEVNKNTVGAARLRAMHARLEASVARRKAALAGTVCP